MKKLIEGFVEEIESEIIHFEMATECFMNGCEEWNFCKGKLEVLQQHLQKLTNILEKSNEKQIQNN